MDKFLKLKEWEKKKEMRQPQKLYEIKRKGHRRYRLERDISIK